MRPIFKAGVAILSLLLLATPIMAIRWWVKHRSIRTNDPDYRQAKRATLQRISTEWTGRIKLETAVMVAQTVQFAWLIHSHIVGSCAKVIFRAHSS